MTWKCVFWFSFSQISYYCVQKQNWVLCVDYMCIFIVFAYDFNQLSCLCGNFKILHILSCFLQTKIILLLLFFFLKFRYPPTSFINLFWLAHSVLGWMTVVNSYQLCLLLFLQERFQCFEVDSGLECEASCPPALRFGLI